jgi:hypothetical protein
VVDFGIDVGQEASLTIDSQDGLHVAYYDATENDLEYARQIEAFDELVWMRRTVDRGGAVGQQVALALDPDTD